MLPKNTTPIYTIDLPLSKKSIRYRPFLVKEEKLLLIAMEANDETSILNTIKQIINNCSLDELDVDELPIVDIEYFFLHLRARSVGEIIELNYKCNNDVETTNTEGEKIFKKCNNIVPVNINILNINPTVDPAHTSKIDLGNNLGMVLKYPTISMLNMNTNNTEIDQTIKIIIECIEYIYDKDNIYYRKDTPNNELVEFIDTLNNTQFNKIKQFFDTIPKIIANVDFKCKKCGYNDKIVVEGLQSFFG